MPESALRSLATGSDTGLPLLHDWLAPPWDTKTRIQGLRTPHDTVVLGSLSDLHCSDEVTFKDHSLQRNGSAGHISVDGLKVTLVTGGCFCRN